MVKMDEDPGRAAELTPPDEFPFPFPAYGVQKQLMAKLFETIENGSVGVFESPTGQSVHATMLGA